jgi:hypothetical protein
MWRPDEEDRGFRIEDALFELPEYVVPLLAAKQLRPMRDLVGCFIFSMSARRKDTLLDPPGLDRMQL